MYYGMRVLDFTIKLHQTYSYHTTYANPAVYKLINSMRLEKPYTQNLKPGRT